MYPTETRDSRLGKARLPRIRYKHVFPARGLFFLHIPDECFSFPCGRVCFAITLPTGQSSWLEGLTALPLGWVNF